MTTTIQEVTADWLEAEKAKPVLNIVHVDVRRVDELASEGMSLHVHTCFRSIEL
jgi:hypothetical protein